MPPRTIDCLYLDQPAVAASYLLRDGAEAAFVDNNTARALPLLLAALDAEGLRPEDVRYVIVTHVHLDHAGGTSALARACPNATVLAHPRAARHLVDPSKLVASARAVYGDAVFDRLYPDIGPIDASRVRALEDSAVMPLGARSLRFLHTRGHANHHVCILDMAEGDIFTGDAFGLAYPRLQRAGLFIFPSTSPTDFDPVEAQRSVQRIIDTGARAAYLTHFNGVFELSRAAAQLREHLDVAAAALSAATSSGLVGAELKALVAATIRPALFAAAARRGLLLSEDDRAFLELDIDLNAQGIAFIAQKRRADASA